MQSTPHQLKTLYHWLCSMLLGFMIVSMSACNAQTPDSAVSATQTPAKVPMGTSLQLTLTGYNYTNRYIDSFEVDGVGGGNMSVSGPGTYGSGSSCCVSYTAGLKHKKVTVRWQADACIYTDYIDAEGGKHNRTHSIFKETEVVVNPNIPDHPGYFEVHIYPDGHVETAITEQASPPRLVLREDREDKSDYPRCPNGKKPKE